MQPKVAKAWNEYTKAVWLELEQVLRHGARIGLSDMLAFTHGIVVQMYIFTTLRRDPGRKAPLIVGVALR